MPKSVIHATTNPWLRRPEAARHLGISASLLEKLDASGQGPRRSLIGRAVLYRLSDLDRWAERRSVGQAEEADGASPSLTHEVVLRRIAT